MINVGGLISAVLMKASLSVSMAKLLRRPCDEVLGLAMVTDDR